MLTVDYGGWGLAVDYGIKILIFTLKNNTDVRILIKIPLNFTL